VFIVLLTLAGMPVFAEGDSEAAPAASVDTSDKETVVLLHGMGRSRASLWVLDMRLRQAGYITLNFPYVTHSKTVRALSDDLHAFIKDNVTTKRYHLVAHSLGNVIIRDGFHTGYPPGLGRVVMMAPPNGPADLARALKDNPIYQWFSGDSGQKLASAEFFKDLPVPDVEFGIIAGDRGQFLTFEEPNDSVVTVESTKLEGMTDWVLIHQAHSFIMNSKEAAEYCVNFLRTGSFHPAGVPTPEPEDAQQTAAMEPEGSAEPATSPTP
jgi:hypothetical protein